MYKLRYSPRKARSTSSTSAGWSATCASMRGSALRPNRALAIRRRQVEAYLKRTGASSVAVNLSTPFSIASRYNYTFQSGGKMIDLDTLLAGLDLE